MNASNPSDPMRADERLDVDVVDRLLRAHLGADQILDDRPPTLTQFTGGSSNLTYLIRYGDGEKTQSFVLRRPPFGTRPKSGHSMIREFRVMSAIRDHYSALPELYFYLPEEESPFGAECYVMAEVPGRKLGIDLPTEWSLDAKASRQFAFSFFDKLIELHQVSIEATGLQGFGRPDGYVERQVLGWNKRFDRVVTGDMDAFEDVRTWLERNRPSTESGASIVHGDFRMDNTIVADTHPHEIRAVLDWEISALGDPMMDLGNALAYWLQADDPADVLSFRMQPSQAPGMPTRDEVLQYYVAKSGHDPRQFDFYLIFGVWRLAVILQQIYYRYDQGQSSNKKFANYGERVVALGNWARHLIDKA